MFCAGSGALFLLGRTMHWLLASRKRFLLSVFSPLSPDCNLLGSILSFCSLSFPLRASGTSACCCCAGGAVCPWDRALAESCLPQGRYLVPWRSQLVQRERVNWNFVSSREYDLQSLANWVLVSAREESRHLSDAHVIRDQVYNVDRCRVRTCDLFCLMWALSYSLHLHYLKCRISAAHSCCQVTTENYCGLKVTWNAAVQLLSDVSGAQRITPTALGVPSSPARTEGKVISSVLTFVSWSGSGPAYMKGGLFPCLCDRVVTAHAGAGGQRECSPVWDVNSAFGISTSYCCIFFPQEAVLRKRWEEY